MHRWKYWLLALKYLFCTLERNALNSLTLHELSLSILSFLPTKLGTFPFKPADENSSMDTCTSAREMPLLYSNFAQPLPFVRGYYHKQITMPIRELYCKWLKHWESIVLEFHCLCQATESKQLIASLIAQPTTQMGKQVPIMDTDDHHLWLQRGQ